MIEKRPYIDEYGWIWPVDLIPAVFEYDAPAFATSDMTTTGQFHFFAPDTTQFTGKFTTEEGPLPEGTWRLEILDDGTHMISPSIWMRDEWHSPWSVEFHSVPVDRMPEPVEFEKGEYKEPEMGWVPLNVIDWAGHEVERQNANPSDVTHLCTAWCEATELHHDKEHDLTAEIVEVWGAIIEPQKNRRGFRQTPVSFRGGGTAIDARKVGRAVQSLLRHGDKLTPQEWVREFLLVHPFADGNGRLASLLYNYRMDTLWEPRQLPIFDFEFGTITPMYVPTQEVAPGTTTLSDVEARIRQEITDRLDELVVEEVVVENED